MTKTQNVVAIAKKIAKTIHNFCESEGPGPGNRKVNRYMRKVRERVERIRGIECDKRFDDEIQSAFDFYIQREKTVIEIALSLKNPLSEFHKDIFKALLAVDNKKDKEMKIEHLVFIAKPGAKRRLMEPSSRAIISWLKKYYFIEVKVEELSGR